MGRALAATVCTLLVALVWAEASVSRPHQLSRQRQWVTELAPKLNAIKSAGRNESFVTLLAADAGHVPGLLNWLGSVPGAVLETVVVLALDADVHAILGMHGATSVLVEQSTEGPGMRQRDFVWLARMELAQALLRDGGVDVLLSDIDAHWLKDPLPLVRHHVAAGAHIVSSRATRWPAEQATRWGAVLCMGFVYVRTAPQSVAFVERVLTEMRASERPDDQVTVNRVLDEEGLPLSAKPDSREPDSATTAAGLRVDLLSAWQVHRGFADGTVLTLSEAQATDGLLVYHAPDFIHAADGSMLPLWVPRKVFDAFDERLLREAGLWKLRDDWRNISTSLTEGGLSGWIHDITTGEATVAETPPLVVFLHVPKAAGTSFAHALMPVFSNCTNAAQCSRSPTANAGSTAGDSCNLWGCQGHFDMTTIEHELQRRQIPVHSAVLVTMLRDPLERVISEHQYALARPSKNKGSLQFLQPAETAKQQQHDTGADVGSFRALMKALRRNMTLDEYIQFPFLQGDFGTINNRQVSLLAGSEHAHERSDFQLRYALRNLQLFDFVGITEDFSASMRLLAHTLSGCLDTGGSTSSKEALESLAQAGSTHLNSGGSGSQTQQQRSHTVGLSAAVRKKLSKKNELDQILYDWAKADFYSRLCSQLGECDGPPSQQSQLVQPPQDEVGQEEKDTGYALDASGSIRDDDGYALDVGQYDPLDDGYALDGGDSGQHDSLDGGYALDAAGAGDSDDDASTSR
jgi:hypothetical protein